MLDPISRAIVRWCAAVALVCVLVLVAYSRGSASERAAHNVTREAHAAVLQTLAEKARAAADKAQAASEAVKRDRAAADARHEEALTYAKREADRLRAALHAGTVRLSDTWACPVPGSGAGDAAADAGAADPGGRHDSAARIVAAADRDAAVIDWLWKSWAADRKAVIAAGCAVESQ